MTTEWLEIDDFSAGIWSAPNTLTGTPFAAAISAPMGASQSEATFGCAPGSSGKGLVPLPGQPTTRNVDLGLLTTVPTQNPYIVGQEIVDGAYEYVALWYISAGGPPTNCNLAIIGAPGDAATDWLVHTALRSVSSAVPTTMTFTQTRMNPTTPYTTPGQPVVGYAWIASDGQGIPPHVTPNPTAPGNNTLDLGLSVAAWVHGHQNRLIIFERTVYTRVTARGESISYSDPANSNVVPATLQRQVFYPEYASGYGAWGSLSAAQLLLIKRFGGACLVEGDIAAPRVTYLPGVTSTGGMVTKMAPTSIGLVYASEGNGLWVWNGGATSEKLSRQLDNSFWAMDFVNANALHTTESGPRVQTQQWGDFIVVSGAWMHHLPTGGWWRLHDPNAIEPFVFAEQIMTTAFSTGLRTCRVRLTATSGSVAYASDYNSTTFTNSWSWHSHPIRVTRDTDVQITDIVLVAQRDASATGNSTLTLTIYNQDGTTQSVTPWTITASARPEHRKFQVKGTGSHIEIKIVAANSSTAPAPMLHSVAIGYQRHNPAPSG